MPYPVVNIVRRPMLGQFSASWDAPSSGLDMKFPNSTSIEPYPSSGTTKVAPWDLATMNRNLAPQTTSEENVDDIYEGKTKQAPPPPPPPPPPPSIVMLETPTGRLNPLPRFISPDEAASAKNLTGLAVTGGILAAGIGVGLLFA